MARTMLHSAKLPYIFWAEAINTATYIQNCCISRALDTNTTPEEIWSGQKPDIQHLRIFGCDAYALIKDHQHKFAPKAEKCIFIGYSTESKAYRLWNKDKKWVIISRDVKFNESSVITNNLVEISTKFAEVPAEPAESESELEFMSEPEFTEPGWRSPTNTTPISSPKTSKSHWYRQKIESNLGDYWNPPSKPRREHKHEHKHERKHEREN